jgi:flagellar FliJ protein
MAPFRFRLATLLKLRENERRQRQLESAQAQEAERILQEQASEVAGEIDWTKARVRSASAPGELPVDGILELQRYALQLKAQAMMIARQAATIRAEVERRRQALLEADRQVRMLEKLRERQVAAHRVELEDRERQLLDEIGQQRFNQNRRVEAERD